MKLPTCARHGPILGVPRTAGRDSGLSLARRARARGPSTSASMSVTTSLRSRSFPSLSTSAGFSLPALPYRASFITPPSKPPIARNRHRARLLGGQCNLTKRWPRGLVNPRGLIATAAGAEGDAIVSAKIAANLVGIRLDRHYIRGLFVLVTFLRFADSGRRCADRPTRTAGGNIEKLSARLTAGLISDLIVVSWKCHVLWLL